MLSTHKRLLKTLVGVCIVALLSPVLALAQDGVTLQKLREQIASMEKIDKDPSTLEETRNLNRNMLAAKRADLAERLTKEIDGLQKYSQKMEQEGPLSESDQEKIATRISSLRQEREALQRPVTAATTVSLPAVQTNNNPTARTASNHPSPATSSATQEFKAACFSNAPTELNNTARAAVDLLLDDDDPLSQFGDLTFYAITHAVAIAEGRDDLLKSLEVKQLQEQTRRTDKQIGAGANSEGSTSAIEKPNFAEILGLAVEHGAIQQAVNSTTLNLSTTPYLFTTLANGDTPGNYKKYGYLTRLGASANFNIEDEDNPLASARRQQLTDWSLRLRLSKDRSTRSDDVMEYWNDIKDDFARPSIVITDALKNTFGSDGELEAQRRRIADRLIGLFAEPTTKAIRANQNLTRDDKINQIATMIVCRIKDDLVDPVINGTFKISPDSKARIVKALPAFAAAVDAKNKALEEFDKRISDLSLKPIFSLAYNNIKPTIGSNYSELKVLYQKKTFDPISLVANAGVSFYHKENDLLRQKTVRDFSVSLALEGTMGRSPFMVEAKDESQMTYSFTGRYERFFENQYFAGRKADIAVAQFKFEIPLAAGMSFPFSVTYANSSELIKEDRVRANFGFTFDTDKLLKALALSKLK